MKSQLSFVKCVMVFLGCYFAYVIINANIKLQSGKIGTIFSKVKEKTVQGRMQLSRIRHFARLRGIIYSLHFNDQIYPCESLESFFEHYDQACKMQKKFVVWQRGTSQYPAITVCLYRQGPKTRRQDLIDWTPGFLPPRDNLIAQHISHFKKSNG